MGGLTFFAQIIRFVQSQPHVYEWILGIVGYIIIMAFLLGFIIGGDALVLMIPGCLIIAVWLSYDTWRDGKQLPGE